MTKSVSKKVLALAVSAAILFLSMSFAADNVHAAEQVKVTVSAKTISEFDIVQKEITVSSRCYHWKFSTKKTEGSGKKIGRRREVRHLSYVAVIKE